MVRPSQPPLSGLGVGAIRLNLSRFRKVRWSRAFTRQIMAQEKFKSTEFKNTNLQPFSVKDFFYPEPPKGSSLSLARQQLIDEGIKEKLSPPVFEAKVFSKALELLPIGIRDNDLYGAYYGEEFAGEEYMSEVTEAEKKEYDTNKDFVNYTQNEDLLASRYLLFALYTPAHTCAPYGDIIRKGLRWYYEKIDKRLSKGNLDEYGMETLYAMKETLQAAKNFAGRYAVTAERIAENCSDANKKRRLLKIADMLKRVPFEPARDLQEALQSIWITHTCISFGERSWASISVGRMDDYLHSYYLKWLKDGNTKEAAIELLVKFFEILDSYGDGACALNIGGSPDYSNESWNELSSLLIDAEICAHRRSPIIAARIMEDMPEDIFNKLMDLRLFEIGQPTFYSESSCLKAMQYRGLEKKEAKRFSINSCMGMVIPGDEIADMWGACVNMNLPLEMAVNNGEPIHGALPKELYDFINNDNIPKPSSIENIKEAYRIYLRGLVEYVTNQNLMQAAWAALNRPDPFFSAIINGCIESGRDRAHSAVRALGEKACETIDSPKVYQRFDMRSIIHGQGAKYHNVTVPAIGFADAADSITAIQELVFEQKKYYIEDIINAARSNYEGDPKDIKILADLKRCSKYGEANEKADSNAQFVLNILADACEEQRVENIRFIPTTHSIDSNILFGKSVYASLDGRKNGEAFGKNAGPVLQVIKNSPTQFCLSAMSLPQYRFSGGFPIDLYFQPDLLKSEEDKKKIQSLFRTYLFHGGMQIQVNSIRIDILKAAYENPKLYPDIIVRKGGFSVYFADLTKEIQRDLIDRLEKKVAG